MPASFPFARFSPNERAPPRPYARRDNGICPLHPLFNITSFSTTNRKGQREALSMTAKGETAMALARDVEVAFAFAFAFEVPASSAAVPPVRQTDKEAKLV